MVDAVAARRDRVLQQVVELLENDERVVASWLSGSLGRGAGDAWSDIDLTVLVEDDAIDAFWEDRQRLYDAIAPQLLRQRPIPQNMVLSPRGHFQLVIFEGPVEVDFGVAPVSEVLRPANTCLLIERRTIPLAPATDATLNDEQLADQRQFFWAMALIAVKYAARDDMLKTAHMISMLRSTLAALGPAKHPPLTRLSKSIALAEIQRLCGEAATLAADHDYKALADEISRLLFVAAETGDAPLHEHHH